MTLSRLLGIGTLIGLALSIFVSAFIPACMFAAGAPFDKVLDVGYKLLALLPLMGLGLGVGLTAVWYLRLWAAWEDPSLYRIEAPVLPQNSDYIAEAVDPPMYVATAEELWGRIRGCALLQLDLHFRQGRSASRKWVTENTDFNQAEWNSARAILRALGAVEGKVFVDTFGFVNLARQLGRVTLRDDKLMVPSGAGYTFFDLRREPASNNYLVGGANPPAEELEEGRFDG